MVARRLLLACLLVLAFNLPALAQSNSGLRGVVVDKDGAPLPSARITVKNDSLGVNQGAVTDTKGEFRIVPLPPGKGYILEVQFPGMGTIKMDVDIAAGKVFATTITLRPSSEMTEHVKITAATDVVNTESTTTSTTFTSEFIDSLPILGRNYQDVLTLAPGVSDVDGDGNPTIHGSRDVDVVTLVDGVSTNDPLTGKRGQELNIDSIQEIEVKTAGATADYGRAQGGFVNIVTKSGGNEFEGRFSLFWRGKTLDGDGAGIDDPRLHGGIGEIGLRQLKFNDFAPFISVGGPIKKDKAWYFFTAEYIQIQDPVNALTQAFVRGTKEDRVFGKVTWDMSTNHKLQFTTTLDPQTYDNEGLDSFTAVESGYTQKRGGLNLTLKETSIFNPNVFLESTVQHFTTKPKAIPTLNADTNHNGILFTDRNHDGFIDATERDAGEDYDRDGFFDVFEDSNHNGILDIGEDRDGDGRLTHKGLQGGGGGCEGVHKEDIDCDGNADIFYEDLNHNGILDQAEDKDGDLKLDYIDEDLNHNGQLDPGEDRNGNGILDTYDPINLPMVHPYIEDRNNNQYLDDRVQPRPDDQEVEVTTGPNGEQIRTPIASNYPYGEFHPVPRDRDFELDERTLRVSGPNAGIVFGQREPSDYTANGGRITLKEDLTVFVPDWHGQHDMKFGGVVERDTYSRDTSLRPVLYPFARPVAGNVINPTVGVRLPAENEVFNQASNTTYGMYAIDTYKPLPNLTLGLGVRFDRETTDSFGYTPFDPVQERNLYDRLTELGGLERGKDDAILGNNDGMISDGYCDDPIFYARGVGNPCDSPRRVDGQDANLDAIATIEQNLARLKQIAPSRLTQHHTATTLVAQSLLALFPDAKGIDPVTGDIIINRQLLREQGAATFQEREAFRLTNNNLAPRMSVSWDPWSDSKTKVFVNWGRFYDRLFLETIIPEEGPDVIYRYYQIDLNGVTAAGMPDGGIGPPLTKAPPSASQVDRGLQTPYSDELTVGFEREIAPEVSIKLTYINKHYRQQLQDRDVNHDVRYHDGAVLDQLGILLPPGSGGGASSQRIQDNRPDLYIHNFFFNQIFRVGNINHSVYHGFELQVTKRLSRKWEMVASYTYSRNLSQAEDFESALGDDPAAIPQEYGYSSDDQRHVVKFNAIAYLPKDWQVGTTMSWATGLPYSVISTFQALDNFDYPATRLLYGYVPDRADALGNRRFVLLRRNDHRNAPILTINAEAQKSFVLGKLNSRFFFTIANLLNKDDLRIFSYQPASPDRSGALQLDSERRFGRRFQIGLQFEF